MPCDLVLDEVLDAAAISRVARSEIAVRETAEVRVQRAGRYLWVRLLHAAKASDLLFRLRVAKVAPIPVVEEQEEALGAEQP
jgi:hypothetical protein